MIKTTRRDFASGQLTAARHLGIAERRTRTRLRRPRGWAFHDYQSTTRVWRLSGLRRICSELRVHRHQYRTTADPLGVSLPARSTSRDSMSGACCCPDAGRPFVAIAGIHAGCFSCSGPVECAPTDLKNGTIAVGWAGGLALVTAMHLRQLRPSPGCQTHPAAAKGGDQLLADGKIDALLGFHPTPELRTRKIGHVVVSTATIDPGRTISAAWPRRT
jgi:hypothetical protein